nr:stefin 1 [Myxozoa sp. AK-2018]
MVPFAGGHSKFYESDDEGKDIFHQVHSDIAESYRSNYGDFRSIKFLGYTKQIVSGIIYILTVEVQNEGAPKCIYCRVYQKLPCHGGDINLIRISKSEEEARTIEK